MRANAFKAALRSGRPQLGVWVTMHYPNTVEMCASSGFDWLLLDGEHAPTDGTTMQSMLQVAAAYPTSAMVRLASGDPHLVGRALDMGTQNLLIPHVETAAHAAELAAAMDFPPRGTRGVSAQTRGGSWGRDVTYLASAREESTLILQVETEPAVRNIDALLDVEGVDALFIGMADLAASMGHLGQPEHPEVLAAYELVTRKARDAGMPLGALTRDERIARQHLADGLAFVAVGTDAALLANALRDLRQTYSDVTTPSQRGNPA